MKISLITINRNNAPGLSRTLKSISAQTMPEGMILEHIIVDGQSTDGSLDDINPTAERAVISAQPLGVYNAINTGIRSATGDIIGLLHSGDIFARDNVLADIYSYFETHADTDFIYGDVRIGHRMYTGENFNIKTLTTGFAPPHPSLYLRRSAATIIGEYDETFRIAADFDYFVRLATSDTVKGHYLPGVMIEMETGGLSASLRNRLWANNTERLRSLRNNGLPASRSRLMIHYRNVLKQFLCSSAKKQ